MSSTGGVWTMSTECADPLCTNITYSQGSPGLAGWLWRLARSLFPNGTGVRGKGWELTDEALLNYMFSSSQEKENLPIGGELALF